VPDESDAGPYPIPASPKIEGNGAPGDRHLLMVDMQACKLWELYAASKGGSGWSAGSGAIFDLHSNALRPDGWTSADAAGLPIYPGPRALRRGGRGVIAHALRFTAPDTRKAHIYPARHDAGSSTSVTYPPMGLRLRLKASVNISGYGPQAQVILTALKRYGMILADNGSAYYITGDARSALGRRRPARPPGDHRLDVRGREHDGVRQRPLSLRSAAGRPASRAPATAAPPRSSSRDRGPGSTWTWSSKSRRRTSDSTSAAGSPPGRSVRPQPAANSVSPLSSRPSSAA
jgi:hypothetical protein